MKFAPIEPPRVFQVGHDVRIDLKDCGRVSLEPDEQVTFVTEGAAEYDVARKSWGFYATPSTNGRLARFNLRTVLVRNRLGQYFVMLVERAHRSLFDEYVAGERLAIVGWLDDAADLARLDPDAPRAAGLRPAACLFCAGSHWSTAFVYDAPPPGEVTFGFSAGDYHREVFRCGGCGHFVSRHGMDVSRLYEQEYVAATYGDGGLRRAFDRITALDPAQSDNAGRAARVIEVAGQWLTAPRAERRPPTVLDVGSGLCVFLHRIKQAGWQCTALDPDPRAASHAREVVGVDAVAGDFMQVSGLGRFDVVTFNKVLEHVLDPIAMLAKSAAHLNPGGLVYVELPDGEAAAAEGPGREEFFVEHHHVFSMASLALLASRAGFTVRLMERLREPSTKFTLRAFLAPRGASAW